MSRTYITTSIPYVNAAPHVGFALELVQADTIARYGRAIGHDVYFQTGSDENAAKNVQAAAAEGVSTRELVDRNSQRFRDLLAALNISADDFLRTTEDRHRLGVHAFWRALRPGDVYRRTYRGLYCTGCEDFYLEKDLVGGYCPEHGTKPVEVAEENYFFRLSAYQQQIQELLVDGRLRIIPSSRRNEVLSFVRRGLSDISISRPASRTGDWGITVPDDDSQVIYVWIDALINYISGLGFGSGENWRQWWNPDVQKVHVIGKNVWKFHAVYWPALLLSAGLPLPDQIIVHGFVTAEGRKIGKSLGNAVDPFACIDTFGCDGVRYYLLRAIPPFDDGDFSLERLRQLHNTDLANGLGNLVSRISRLCERAEYGCFQDHAFKENPRADEEFAPALSACEFDKALSVLWNDVDALNRQIEAAKPWKLLDGPGENRQVLHVQLTHWLARLSIFVAQIAIFLPQTAERINLSLFDGPIRHRSPLFVRR